MQINQGYRIIERFPHRGEKGFVLGCNPDAPNPYVTRQYRADDPEHYFWGHYHNEKKRRIKTIWIALSRKQNNTKP